MRLLALVGVVVTGCSAGTPEIGCLYDCVPASDLAEGDADEGRDFVLNQGYSTCGVPTWLYELSADLLGEPELIEGRTGTNAVLDFRYTASMSPRGVEVVNTNCLSCHADLRNGELVLGAPNVTKISSSTDRSTLALLRLVAESDEELTELEVSMEIAAVTDRFVSDTVGLNVGASTLMAIAAHRDPDTLAWTDEAHMDEPGTPPLLDPPAWWTMRKKNAMFANTAGRGDWSMMAVNAGVACAESVEASEAIYDASADVRAFVQSIEPPAWPWTVDEKLARKGERVFEDTCAECHGLYAEDEADEVYPNLVVPIEVVGTDPYEAEAAGVWQDAWDGFFALNVWGEGVDWQPQAGYIAPPLDGIWASAPYFHNGSVPTLAGVIDSAARPTMWRRTSLDSDDYEQDEVGWRYEVLDGTIDDVASDEQVYVHDTSQERQHATGHTFGDALDDDERTALLEYLKTL
ncbi:MAG: c-type cytochrome [Myxococcales bacterium]|nr:c-type cytochrome [Myxococcales bacterium]